MLKSSLFHVRLSRSLTVVASFKTKSVKNVKYDPSILLTGFECYAKIHGVKKMKFAFRVPKNDLQWPKSTWGLPLGASLDRIRNRNSSREIRPQLLQLGFDLEPIINYSNLFTALNVYNSINSHVQVPSNYCIPRDDNRYPDYLRGKHLGKAVHSAQKYGCYEEHHDKLKEMGVNFDIFGAFHVEFGVIYDASKAYHKIHDNLDVPHNFIVPYGLNIYPKHTWGLELGYALRMIRTTVFHSEHKERLIPLGLNLYVNSKRDFETVYSALETYKSIHGNLNIPQKFVVPSDDVRYPREMWGMNLGRDLHSIRIGYAYFKHRDKLIALGVNFVVAENKVYKFATVYQALVAYKSIHNDLLVLQSFVVPHNDSNYPSETWGMNLGSIVSDIRNNNTYSQYKERLIELGFVYDAVSDIHFERIYSALVAYKSIHVDLLVPHSFVIPHNDSNYPSETWGTNLGSIVSSIRNINTYSEYKERLTELGFVYDVKDVHFERIYSALVAYKSIYGNVLVPAKFVVPADDLNYPSEIWGTNLGVAVYNIRNNNAHSEYKGRLTELGFVFDAIKDVHFERFYSALVAYKSIYGNVLVPTSFVISHNDSNYPSETWGTNLGSIVNHIRNNNTYSDYKGRLTELGFVYDALKNVQFDRIYSALVAYKSIHGDVLVPAKFVIPPDDSNYPSETWGLNLGLYVHHIRNRGDYAEYKERLTELGFVYDAVKDVHFERIYSALVAYKSIHGNLLVRKSFVVPVNDSNYPSETWGMKLGITVSDIRNRGNYSRFRSVLEGLGIVYPKK